MAAPEVDVRIQSSMRIPEDIYARLQVQSAERRLSVNWLVTKAIELYLERLEEISEDA